MTSPAGAAPGERSAGSPPPAAAGPTEAAAADAGSAAIEPLRVRTDRLRSRVWVLGLDEVRVYDLIDRRLLRRIAIAPWSVARGVCAPDMVLDRSGAAIVASNAEPTLWRIDGVSFEKREHPVRLRGKEQWEVGFGALAFDADGTLHALAAAGHTLWRVELAQGVADLIETYRPPLTACALTTYTWQQP